MVGFNCNQQFVIKKTELDIFALKGLFNFRHSFHKSGGQQIARLNLVVGKNFKLAFKADVFQLNPFRPPDFLNKLSQPLSFSTTVFPSNFYSFPTK